jgi:pyruvate-formate lyase-activating enzyme
MVNREQIQEVIGRRLKRVLTAIQLCVPSDKFFTCRKVVLDEFGNSGAIKDLLELYGSNGSQGRIGSGGPTSRKKDGAL